MAGMAAVAAAAAGVIAVHFRRPGKLRPRNTWKGKDCTKKEDKVTNGTTVLRADSSDCHEHYVLGSRHFASHIEFIFFESL